MAMERGARLVIEEIEKTSDELLSHLLHVCDESQSRIVLPDETIVTPREGFHVVATSNVEDISELPESLLDRFTIRIVVTELHPDAIASLPEDLIFFAGASRVRENAECTRGGFGITFGIFGQGYRFPLRVEIVKREKPESIKE
jgi:hypothetical protein